MLIYKSRFLTRGEVWFDDEPDGTPVDWIYYRQRSSPVAKGRWKYFYTRLIDLAKSPAELLSEMDEKTARKINEAQERDKMRCERCEPIDSRIMDEVEKMWNEHADARGSARLDRDWLKKIIEAGTLELSAAREPGGKVLVYHLNYVGKNRAQALIMVSHYRSSPNPAVRNTINRANCLGYWNSLLRLKARGLRYFDLGGWYPGTTDMLLLGLNAFKKGFGGQVVREYECEQILTMKGWVVLTIVKMLNKVERSRPLSPVVSEGKANARSAIENKISPAF